jgi:hypothetical protein
MRPPQRRVPSIDLRDTRTLHSIAVNVTAAVTAVLLLRLASLFVSGSDEAALPSYVQWVTEPLVWPFKQLPVISAAIVGDARVADLLIVPMIFLTGLFIAGIIAGWGEASQPPVHRRSLRRRVLD